MAKRVIVIDESAFIRGMLSEIVNKKNGFKVINRYRNIKDNLKSIKRLKADVLILNIDKGKLHEIDILKRELLDELDIIIITQIEKEEFLKEINFEKRIKHIHLSEDFTVESIKNIEKYILQELETIEELENKIHAKIERKTVTIRSKKRIEAIVIGASTGGPRALTKVLTSITKKLNVPILIVQHMPTGFTKAFAERLNRGCSLYEVKEAHEGMNIEKNCIYIAKGGIHMEVSKEKKIVFNDDKQIWGVKPAGDKLFISAAKAYNGNILACVLTGMGKDCSNGVCEVKKLGGTNIVESEKTCLIFGMPKAAIDTGMVDFILDIDKIAEKIEQLVKGY